MAQQDSMNDVQNQVSQIGDNLKSAYSFAPQRKAVSDWWNDKVGAARNLWNKYGGAGDVKAAETPSASGPQPKTVTSSTTTPSIKRSAAKRKTAGGISKSFGGK